MAVNNCFSVPIYTYQFDSRLLELIQQEITVAVKNVRETMTNPWPELVTSTFKWEGNNTFLDNVPIIKEQILDHYKIYLKEINAKQIPNLSLSASFLNIITNQGFQFSHHHPDCVISGVYYHQIDTTSNSNIIFENPNPICDFVDPTGSLWPNHAEVSPNAGKLVMFPSWLKHRVSLSYSNYERIAIAFNLS